jgi:uncharacterized membrane protein YbhN (UPF0104 family)
MRKRLSTILFLIGVMAVIVMLMTFEISFSELWSHIHRAGYWLVAAILLWGTLYGLNALTLRIIICGSGSCPIGFGRLWQIVVSGFALNTTVPVGGIGGEPYRIMELSKYIGVERATSSPVFSYSPNPIDVYRWLRLSSPSVCECICLNPTPIVGTKMLPPSRSRSWVS